MRERERLARRLVLIESRSPNHSVAEAVEYYQALMRLVRILPEKEVERLKLAARSWKRIFHPLSNDANEELVMIAAEFYETVEKRERRIEVLGVGLLCGVMTDRMMGILEAAMKGDELEDALLLTAYLNALRLREPDVWLRMASYIVSSSHHDEYGYLANIRLDGDTFENVLVAALRNLETDYAMIRQLFHEQLGTSEDVGVLLESMASAAFMFGGLEMFIQLTPVLQQNSHQIACVQLVPWITLFLSLCEHYGRGLDASTYLWIIDMINMILNEGGELMAPGELRVLSDLREHRFSLSALAELSLDNHSLLGHVCWLCQYEPFDQYHQRTDDEFLPGSIVVGVTEERGGFQATKTIQQPAANSPNSKSMSDLKSEIEALKAKRADLETASSSSPTNVPRDSLFVLDTSVLINCIEEVKHLVQKRPVRLAVPSTVLTELEGLSCGRGRKSKLARGVLDYFDRIPNWNVGSIHGMSLDGKLMNHLLPLVENLPSRRQIKTNDDAIIYAAGQADAVVVSDDVNLTLRGRANNVLAISWSEFIDLFPVT